MLYPKGGPEMFKITWTIMGLKFNHVIMLNHSWRSIQDT